MNNLERAYSWARQAEPAISGSGGHKKAFELVRALMWKFELTDSETLEVASSWNQSNSEKFTDGELMHKIEQARGCSNRPASLIEKTRVNVPSNVLPPSRRKYTLEGPRARQRKKARS